MYDIYYFFMQGFSYNTAVIQERGDGDVQRFFENLHLFIEQNVTDVVIREDLSPLLSYDKFIRARKSLKLETLMFIRDEIARLEKTSAK